MPSKRITIEYYAILKEQRGKREETIETAAVTPRELYTELKSRHGFKLSSQNLRLAVNDEFANWNTPLRAGDRVIFIPPVAGG